jgi:hypothetical protein
VLLKHRRQFCRVVNQEHPLYGAVVEFSGHGRGWDVYAIVDGVEHVFRNGDLEPVEAGE